MKRPAGQTSLELSRLTVRLQPSRIVLITLRRPPEGSVRGTCEYKKMINKFTVSRSFQIVYFNDFGPDVLYVAGQVMGTYEPLKGINSVHSVHD